MEWEKLTAFIYRSPWAIVGYASGFQGHQELRLSIEQQWKIERDRLQQNECHDLRSILHSVQSIQLIKNILKM